MINLNAAFQAQSLDSFITKSTLLKVCPLLTEHLTLRKRAVEDRVFLISLTWVAKLLFLAHLDVLNQEEQVLTSKVMIETRKILPPVWQ
jgi:hypothetical protein